LRGGERKRRGATKTSYALTCEKEKRRQRKQPSLLLDWADGPSKGESDPRSPRGGREGRIIKTSHIVTLLRGGRTKCPTKGKNLALT